MKRFKSIIRKIGLFGRYDLNLKDEKGFVNGVFVGTKWGITAPMLAAYLGRTPKANEMQDLNRVDAIKLLYQRIWLGRGLINLKNESVASLIYNGISNIGTNEMRLLIKQVVIDLGAFIDYFNVFTPKGIDLLNSLDQKALFHKLYRIKKKAFKKIKSKGKKRLFLSQLDRIKFTIKKDKPSKLSIKNRVPQGVVESLYRIQSRAS